MPLPIVAGLMGLGRWAVSGLGIAIAGTANAAVSHINTNKSLKKQAELAENRHAIEKASKEGDHQLQRELFEKRRALELQMLQVNRETQLLIVQEQRENARRQSWYQKRVDNWPLKLVPEDIVEAYPNRKPTPIRVILAPPEIDYDRFRGSSGEQYLNFEMYVAQRIRSVFDRHFPLDCDDRPIELLDRSWDSSRFGGGSTIRTLFGQLKSEPIIILESEVCHNKINCSSYLILSEVEGILLQQSTGVSTGSISATWAIRLLALFGLTIEAMHCSNLKKGGMVLQQKLSTILERLTGFYYFLILTSLNLCE
ncbi:hypothetical protein PN466_09010 [Roseofilum reptotaenium CS-1145]|uniref:Uncharacterized protein n=1 Tax=Roseofilum reptotaenium AO1-A TaxID=1925591 RepID=A0A1L9QNA7_9CYAN|nr:hypothetical protein [Roseofilum reptotaenium]MDB9517086.1 hypothetical protein [Roseofilum reptotaenium CS-1145]OJJ24168.1 hypothetical protein BI308_18040 [Roseofilum reptotaenium AO1-A]